MKNVFISTGKHLSRRTLLKSAGVGLGLPFLEAMSPAFAAAPATGAKAKRFVSISLTLGLHGPNWVPANKGAGYTPSPYLKPIQDLRDDFTVVSGTSHPGVSGGHTAEGSILSACPNVRGSTTRNSISLDQLMAKHLGHETRFPSLVLNSGRETSPSYTENAAMIPAIYNPVKLYTKLFVDDSRQEQERQAELIRRGRSVMDLVGAEAKTLKRELGAGDRDKLDSWFTSVRELEQRLAANEAWVHKSKPKVSEKAPRDYDQSNVADIQRAMLDVVALALQTDSTRFATFHISSNDVRGIEGVDESYHGLSHHGRDSEKLEQLAIVEGLVVKTWGDFLRKLKATEQANGTLLDETMVLLTSNLGNASSHDNRNMPVLFGGGSFKHGRHLAFNQKSNYPLPNLYLNALHQVGLDHSRFATSTGEMTGLV
ncbi:MAG: hypothetical protein ACI8W8_000763 [Rhodothermales bacterium]|jgi:hypothetical protein